MIGNLFSIASSAMQNAQSGISIHGNNITNLKTPGYRRRTVAQTENSPLQIGSHSFGTGASIDKIKRNLNQFIERGVLDKTPDFSRWNAESGNLAMVEKLFVESTTAGISNSMSGMWAAWQSLANGPQLGARRVALVGAAQKFTSQISSTKTDLLRQQKLITTHIKDAVSKANDGIKQIADLNQRIIANPTDNSLLDRRDATLRGLATYVDIKTSYEENGQVTVSLGEGQKLVDGDKSFEFKFENGGVRKSLMPGSTFADDIHFSGSSGDELLINVVSDGNSSGTAPAAQFKISKDGGKTWLKNTDGTDKFFDAGAKDKAVTVGGVNFWFGQKDNSASPATTPLKAGDRFTLTPKSEVRWYKNSSTSEPLNPVKGNDGARRLRGGAIAGLLRVRDEKIGSYIEKLDTYAKSVAWEVNRAHSQGAGLTNIDNTIGTYSVKDSSVPLSSSNLPYAGKLNSGSLSMAFYNATTGAQAGVTPLDFSSITPGTTNFDPQQHSLTDVKNAINASFSGKATAVITNGKLSIRGTNNHKFQFSNDSAGLLAGLGINTFFEGSSADSIKLNSSVSETPSRIAAAHVNGAGEVNQGDNTTARTIASLANKNNVGFKVGGSTTEKSFNDFYSSLVASVGSDAADAKANQTVSKAVLKNLTDKQESVGGVNLDEEMNSLTRYQQSYKSAAKLIQTANAMFEVLLALK